MSKRTMLSDSILQYELPPCGALAHPNGSVCWRVWAPSVPAVELVLQEPGPDDDQRRAIVMQAEPGGYFAHTELDIKEGRRYSYRLAGGPERPDPASRWQPDGVHRPSAVVWLDRFGWSEGDWPGIPRENLVLYELHVGTFTPAGTFDAALERLEELRELGITAIELMPVCQFAGDRGWGYDGVHLFAVQNSYGGPRGLQRFVNACHRTGLAVLLDVVYNHFGPEGNYLGEFGPFITNRHHTPWGGALNFDDSGCDAVRAFVLDNVRHWIRDYHVDGLRLDAVHAIHDESPRNILREIKEVADEEAWQLGRPVHVIAESDLNDVRLLDRASFGGYGLSAQWSDDFHHAVHGVLTGERQMYYADFGRPEQLAKALNETFVYDGCYSVFRGRHHGAPAGRHPGSRFVISIQNHDQVGNRARGDRFATLLNPAQQRLAAGLLLLAPHIPLLFMGEEYGESRPFPFFCSFSDPQIAEAARRGRRQEFAAAGWDDDVPDPQAESTFESAKLSWSWPEGSRQAGLRRLYYDLLTLRRFRLPLSEFPERTADFAENGSIHTAILRLRRHGVCNQKTTELVAYFNLTGQPRTLSGEGRPAAGLRMSSEASGYGGARKAEDPLEVLLPFEFQIFGPDTIMTGTTSTT
jgi:maltooligosyltrehalose trehalohydrolase